MHRQLSYSIIALALQEYSVWVLLALEIIELCWLEVDQHLWNFVFADLDQRVERGDCQGSADDDDQVWFVSVEVHHGVNELGRQVFTKERDLRLHRAVTVSV